MRPLVEKTPPNRQEGPTMARRERAQAVVNDQARVRNWTHLPPLAAWT